MDLIFSRYWYFSNPIELIEPTCSACGGPTANTFVINGRGGLPPSPSNLFNSDAVWVDWDLTAQPAENHSSLEELANLAIPTAQTLVEAAGWVLDGKGQVALIASQPTTSRNPRLTAAQCHAL